MKNQVQVVDKAGIKHTFDIEGMTYGELRSKVRSMLYSVGVKAIIHTRCAAYNRAVSLLMFLTDEELSTYYLRRKATRSNLL